MYEHAKLELLQLAIMTRWQDIDIIQVSALNAMFTVVIPSSYILQCFASLRYYTVVIVLGGLDFSTQ